MTFLRVAGMARDMTMIWSGEEIANAYGLCIMDNGIILVISQGDDGLVYVISEGGEI